MKEQKYIEPITNIISGTFLRLCLLCAILQACSPAVHIKENEYLLKSYPAFAKAEKEPVKFELDSLKGSIENLVEAGHSSLPYDVLYYAVKTKPNRKMLIIKPYLMLYNLGLSIQKNDYKIERLYKWLFPRSPLLDSISNVLVNTAGEKPVLVDTALLNKDVVNLKSVYFGRGYFHPEISYRIDPCKSYMNRQQARVTFLIKENEAWIIDSIVYQVAESNVQKLIVESNAQKDKGSFLKKGDLYSEANLTAERARIATLMRNHGYFKFTPSMINFEIDTFKIRDGDTEANNRYLSGYRKLRVIIKIPEKQRTYKINTLTLYIEPSHVKMDDYPMIFRPKNLTDEMRKEFRLKERVLSDSLNLTMKIYNRALDRLNVNLLNQRFAIKEGQLYQLENEKKTIRRIQDLGIFRFTLVNYEVNDSLGTLDALVHGQLTERYQFKAGLEGFSQNDQSLRTNLPGFGGHLNFRDKMFFKGAEKLDITAQGALSFLYLKEDNAWRTFYEIGAKANLTIPRLLVPFLNMGRNLSRLSPNTSFSVNLNSQERLLYKRTIFGLNWNYSWFHRSTDIKSRSSLSPYIINFIQSDLDSAFKAQIAAIQNPFLRAFTALDFQPRFSSKFNYKFSYSDFQTTRTHSTRSFLPQFEFGGNTPWLIDRLFNPDGNYRDGRIDSIYYGQFVKFSCEYKSYHPLTKKSEFVWRVFSGVADPWNFSHQVPFDSRFFAGGTNSMRGWASNTLGPGTWQRDENINTQNSTADFLISPGGEFSFEANAELRANVYKFIELAIFTDVGNVWFLPTSSFDFEGGKLSKNTILQVGWDAGIGFRFDFSFFIFRIDLAQQIYAPDIQDFVIKSFPKDLGGNRFQLNFGIGYPF